MQEKGKKIGELSYVLKRQESDGNVNNVNQQVRINDVDIPQKTPIVVKIDIHNNPEDNGTTFEAKSYSGRCGFSIPRDVIRELDLYPGHSVRLVIFERKVSKGNGEFDISDNANVIDRVSANNGGRNSVGSRLYSQKAQEYINKNGGEAKLKFRDVRTGNEAVGISHTDYESRKHKHTINFPSQVREEIDVEIGDLIEIIVPGEATDSDNKPSQDERIDEIHSMVSEMYDSYLENKND